MFEITHWDGIAGYVCYGATKRGQPQMTSSLADELTKGVQGYAPQPYLTECIYQLFLESQLPHKIVNSLLITTN